MNEQIPTPEVMRKTLESAFHEGLLFKPEVMNALKLIDDYENFGDKMIPTERDLMLYYLQLVHLRIERIESGEDAASFTTEAHTLGYKSKDNGTKTLGLDDAFETGLLLAPEHFMAIQALQKRKTHPGLYVTVLKSTFELINERAQAGIQKGLEGVHKKYSTNPN